MAGKVGLVVGASGLVGWNLVCHIAGLDGWKALGVSRKKPALDIPFQHVPFDLLDPAQCRAAIAAHPDITHVFLAARTRGATYEEEEIKNVEILRNLLDALEQSAPDLRHVHLVHGTKWYGAHLGQTRVPFRENDHRLMPPNPYYAQHDYLVERQAGKRWTWSSSRPSLVFGFSAGYPHNIICLTGVYAAICRELGMQLRFPGTQACFHSYQSAVDIRILCRALVWMAENPAAANNAFNVANGDVFTWSNLWPRIAKFFDVEFGYPQKFPLVTYMADKEKVWRSIVKKHGLRELSLNELVTWDYGEFHYNKEGSDISSLVKLQKAGFHDVADSEDLFLEILQKYRDERVLP